MSKLETILDNTEKNHPKIYASMHTASNGISNTIRFIGKPYTAMRLNYKKNLADTLKCNAIAQASQCLSCAEPVRRYADMASKTDFCVEHQKLYPIIHHR